MGRRNPPVVNKIASLQCKTISEMPYKNNEEELIENDKESEGNYFVGVMKRNLDEVNKEPEQNIQKRTHKSLNDNL